MKISILDALTLGKDIDLSPINTCGEVVSYETTKPHEVEERVKDAEVIISNKVVLNESNLSTATNVKLIAVAATGYNNVDLDYARQRGIAVTNVAGYSTQSVTQHTFAMLFYLMEQLKSYDEYVKSGEYKKSEIFTHIAWPFYELHKKTLGIIGLGAIGQAVAKVAEAFGMRVIYYSTSGKHDHPVYERVSLEKLLEESDVVSIHAPLNENTKGLINAQTIKQMKQSAYLLNLGRGGIVVEEDLIEALNQNQIAGAALDVLVKEPMDENHPISKLKVPNKLLITPHIAWASIEARGTLVAEIIRNIEAYKQGESRNRIV